MKKEFIIWLFNNYQKDENDLFYDKLDFKNIQDRYTIEELEEKYFELYVNF